jgi:DNA topoisomerase I
MDAITLDDALELFTLPRLVGQTKDGEDITATIGPFGPYVKAGKTSVSIKPEDPFSVTLEKAQELIIAKREEAANRIINDFGVDGIQVLNGRFGPYITDGKKNAKIPKDTDPKDVTLKQAQELIAAAPVKRAPKRRARKSSK